MQSETTYKITPLNLIWQRSSQEVYEDDGFPEVYLRTSVPLLSLWEYEPIRIALNSTLTCVDASSNRPNPWEYQEFLPLSPEHSYSDIPFMNVDTMRVTIEKAREISSADACVKLCSHNLIHSRVDYMSLLLIRPPGHHAYRNEKNQPYACGFCYSNNMSNLIKPILNRKGRFNKVLLCIIDFDAHSGTGTMRDLKLWLDLNADSIRSGSAACTPIMFNFHGKNQFDHYRKAEFAPWYRRNIFGVDHSRGKINEGLDLIKKTLLRFAKKQKIQVTVAYSAGFDFYSSESILPSSYMKTNSWSVSDFAHITREIRKIQVSINSRYANVPSHSVALLEGGYTVGGLAKASAGAMLGMCTELDIKSIVDKVDAFYEHLTHEHGNRGLDSMSISDITVNEKHSTIRKITRASDKMLIYDTIRRKIELKILNIYDNLSVPSPKMPEQQVVQRL